MENWNTQPRFNKALWSFNFNHIGFSALSLCALSVKELQHWCIFLFLYGRACSSGVKDTFCLGSNAFKDLLKARHGEMFPAYKSISHTVLKFGSQLNRQVTFWAALNRRCDQSKQYPSVPFYIKLFPTLETWPECIDLPLTYLTDLKRFLLPYHSFSLLPFEDRNWSNISEEEPSEGRLVMESVSTAAACTLSKVLIINNLPHKSH